MRPNVRQQRDMYVARLADTRQALIGLRRYLTSHKFNGPEPFDNYVNRDDVLRWMEQEILPTLHGELDHKRQDYNEKVLLAPSTRDHDFEHNRQQVTG